MVAELAARREAIAATGTQVAFVHMHDEERAGTYFGSQGLADVPRVSDPGQQLYAAFEVVRGRPAQWLSAAVLKRYVRSLARGYRPAYVGADPLQMPAAFLIARGTILRAARPQSVAEEIDWKRLLGTEE
jgi:hypothetical protein